MFVLMLEALEVHWGDDFIFGIPDDKADDLEHLMREVFKVKICERVGPGFLTSVEFLHKKVGWNAEGFSWTHDPKHTLAMAEGFGFSGKKQLDQTKWKITVAPGSKTVGKGLRDGADGLDEQETHNSTDHWLAQHCMLDKTDQKHNMQRKKQRDSCLDQHVPRSVRSNVCASITARHPYSAGVFHIKICQVRSGR